MSTILALIVTGAGLGALYQKYFFKKMFTKYNCVCACCVVFSSRNPPPMRTENRLIVENLSSRISWQVSLALGAVDTS